LWLLLLLLLLLLLWWTQGLAQGSTRPGPVLPYRQQMLLWRAAQTVLLQPLSTLPQHDL
jgi:hypothetical protein